MAALADTDYRVFRLSKRQFIFFTGFVLMAVSSASAVHLYNMLSATSPMPPIDPDECFKAKGEIETSHYLGSEYEKARSDVRSPAQDAQLRNEEDAEACHRARMQRRYGFQSPSGNL